MIPHAKRLPLGFVQVSFWAVVAWLYRR